MDREVGTPQLLLTDKNILLPDVQFCTSLIIVSIIFKDDLADVAVLPAQDSLASVDCGGVVRTIDYDTMEVVAVWEGALRKHIRGYR